MSVICVTLCSFFSFFWSSLSRAVIGHGSGAALVPPKMIRRLPRGQKKTSPFGFFCFHTTISIRYGTQREHGMIVFHSRWKQRCQIASDVFFFDLWNHFFTKIGTAFKLSLPTFTEFWWPISEVSLFFFKFGWLEKDVHTEKDGTRKEKKKHNSFAEIFIFVQFSVVFLCSRFSPFSGVLFSLVVRKPSASLNHFIRSNCTDLLWFCILVTGFSFELIFVLRRCNSS